MGRKRRHPENEPDKDNSDRPPELSKSTLPPGSHPPTGSKTWKEYLIAEGLISEEGISRQSKAFPMNSDRAGKYRRNLEDSIKFFDEHIVEDFDLKAATKTLVKAPPEEAKIKDFELKNESGLKVLSGRNCFIRDGTKDR